MRFCVNVIRTAAVALCLAGLPDVSFAELTRLEITAREDVLGGKVFGTTGAYEKIRGIAHFAVDPKNPRNLIIANLDKAPRNRAGKVEFQADFIAIKPKDAAQGNGVLLFNIVNRGRFGLLGPFNRGEGSNDPTTAAHFGDESLMRQGYTLVAVGWQFDVSRQGDLVGFTPPVATDDGRPIQGWMRAWFIPSEATPSFEYVTGYNTAAYPPINLNSPENRLTVREGIISSRGLLPRDEWQFGRMVDGKFVADPNWITLKGGFQPGMTYEVMYRAQNPPVSGLGLASIRDMASALKYNSNMVAPGKYAYMYGSSQTGRLIRQIIHEGFTIDEQERKAFDAALVNTGGTGEGSFNEPFARPNHLGAFTGTEFPIQYQTTTDPVTGEREGLGDRIPAGLEPKIMLFDTSSEYWDRGRVAALRHTSIDGTRDQPDAPNVRAYHAAGTRHGSGSVPVGAGAGQFPSNTLSYVWAHRGLLAALDKWVREGVEPPASRHPSFADGTLIARDDLKFPAIPGVQWPTTVPGGFRADVPGPYSTLPFLVSTLDADGNEVGGIRLPEQVVPLATHTGWQFRSEKVGAPETLILLGGSYIPFPKTAAERQATGDPRLSIMERYTSRADYLQKIEAAGKKLAEERYILQEDVPALVEEAGRHWDWRMGTGQNTSND
jgi:hypothetical protein